MSQIAAMTARSMATAPKRTKSIKIRVTDAELVKLRERCPGELAVWLRELGLGQPRPRIAEHIDPALLRQLAGAGNLLNQIARRLNAGAVSDRVEMLAALRHIEQRLHDIERGHRAD